MRGNSSTLQKIAVEPFSGILLETWICRAVWKAEAAPPSGLVTLLIAVSVAGGSTPTLCGGFLEPASLTLSLRKRRGIAPRWFRALVRCGVP